MHDLRVGLGYDRHRLEALSAGKALRPLVVGGVRLESDRGLVAHSDGDALLHAVTDAILGAIGDEDIGRLFPNDDPRNEGRDSAEFVREAASRAAAGGWRLVNLDCVVLLERPRIGAVRERIRASILGMLEGLRPSGIGTINVKGKSGEGVGEVGQSRLIEAHAVVFLARGGG